MHAIADCAAALGSRFNLIFDPQTRRVYQNCFETFPGRPLQLNVSVQLPDGEEICLPFRDADTYFEGLEYFPTLTGFKYRGRCADYGLELELSVRAPFYPGDIRLSTAPFYFLSAVVRPLQKGAGGGRPQHPVEGRVVFSLSGESECCRRIDDGFQYRSSSGSAFAGGNAPEEGYETVARCRGLDGVLLDEKGVVYAPFDFTESSQQTLDILWTGWCESAVLELRGRPSRFKYSSMFESEPEMASWAISNRSDIMDKCRFFDTVSGRWSFGASATHLSALSFHSFLSGSWWTVDEDGNDWFSVWEGERCYHSPVDVEYNNAFFYLNFWPGLLDRLLDQWAELEESIPEKKTEKGLDNAGFLRRDLGAGHGAGRHAHPDNMGVEVNADYLLLMAFRTFFTGDTALLRQYMPLCRRLAAFIIDSDDNGDGFPDTATLNTVEGANAALHYSGAQSYLSVKAQAALWALGEMEDLAGCSGARGYSERWKAFAAKGVKTLGDGAWIKDHFAVTLRRNTDGMTDPLSGESLPEGELEGWNDYSIFTCNGLLYLFAVNMKMPRWNHMRFISDIETAEEATRGPYGNSHTSGADDVVWFSQNIWRDLVACYYGTDYLDKMEGYMDYQQLKPCGKSPALYRDSTAVDAPCVSSRGLAVFGMLAGAPGLRINRIENEIQLAPVRRTLKMPIPALADWDSMRMPWIVAETREGLTTVRFIEGEELCRRFKVRALGAELEEM